MRATLVTNAPYEAPRAAQLARVQQHKSQSLAQYKVPWQGGEEHGKLAFLAAAKELGHPAQEDLDELPPDLVAVIRWCVGAREGAIQWRESRLKLLLQAADELKPLDAHIKSTLSECVLHVVGQYNLAFLACAASATSFPDEMLLRDFCQGFPAWGWLPSAGCFVPGDYPMRKQVDEVFNHTANYEWNRQLLESTQLRGERAAVDVESPAWQAVLAVWAATAKELSEGWAIGARGAVPCPVLEREREFEYSHRGFASVTEFGNHPWVRSHNEHRFIRRFGVFQKGKWRPIDDCTENGINLCTGSADKLTLFRSDVGVQAATCYVRERDAWRRRLVERGSWAARSGSAAAGELAVDQVEIGLDDCRKAFRRLPTRKLMVVVVFNPITMRAEIILLPCFVFGCLSAVMGWNRYSHFASHISRRLLAVPVTEYFDDFQTHVLALDKGSAQRSMASLLDCMIGFDAAKHFDQAVRPAILGVLTDLTDMVHRACASMSVAQERKDEIACDLRAVFAAGTITHAQALKLFGRVRFALCPRFGRVFVAALQPLQQVYSRVPVVPGEPIFDCISALLRIIPEIRSVEIPLRPAVGERPVVILTDAMWRPKSRTADPWGRIGVLLWTPYREQEYWFTWAYIPVWMVILFQRLQFKLTYICQAELVAAACVYLTFPDLLEGRLVHHFVDNDAAKAGMISGYSGKPDSARVLLEMHVAVSRLQCHPWIGFVYSGDNISDDPSRGEFGLVRRLGAAYRACVFPALDGPTGI
jgi:hypothetical protein